MVKIFLKSTYWEDSKLISYVLFFISVNLVNLIIFSSEKINFMIIFLHLKTFFSLPLIFLYKNNWSVLIHYFFFQLIGRMLVEVGYSFYYFSSEILVFAGLLLKLGVFPLVWWYPPFLKKKNWINFFFFKTLNKFPILWILGWVWIENMFLIFKIVILFRIIGLRFSTIKFRGFRNIKFFLGWVSIIDTVFFVWLIQIKSGLFCMLFILYTILYFLLRGCFFFSIEKKISFLNSSLNSKLQASGAFILGRLMVLFLIGFPPLLPFYIKFSIISGIFPMGNFVFVCYFFIISLIQALFYLKVFFSVLKKKSFFFFQKIHSKILFFIWFFFFFFLFW